MANGGIIGPVNPVGNVPVAAGVDAFNAPGTFTRPVTTVDLLIVGGGGAGQNGGGAGQAGQQGTASGNDWIATNGQAGSISGAGSGGAGVNDGQSGNSGAGGNGGSFGNAGAAGVTSATGGAGGAGGAAGKGINLNGNSITWEDGQGNVQGAVS